MLELAGRKGSGCRRIRRWPRPGAVREARQELEEYLAKYEITLSVMQTATALERIAYEFVLDAAADGLRYVEVRYSPLLHRPRSPWRRRSRPARRDQARRSGDGHQGRADRVWYPHAGPAESLELARAAAGYRTAGVVAFDLAGAERASGARPCGRVRVRHAARHGVYLPRRGRGRPGFHPPGAAPVRRPADRARHAIGEDPALLEYVIERKIRSRCASPRICTRIRTVTRRASVQALFDQGVVVTLNTDGRLVDGISLTDEYFVAQSVLGLTKADLARVVLNACDSAFLPEFEKVALVSRVQSELEAL